MSENSPQEHGINAPENFADDAAQNKIVNELIKHIETYAFMMKRALDLGNVDEAFKHATKFIESLRTNQLTPANYNQVYLEAQTNLHYLNSQIRDTRFTEKQIREQYEVSQYESGCLQRLYCMITVSTELVHRKVVKVIDILDDLADMVHQAQDPIRALFLRNFLLTIWKQELPDSTPEEMEKSLNFLLNNFAQMNRMWVRIADIMATDSRIEQRRQLSELIGKNIQQISSLHGITVDNYSQQIFPFIAKHVELCEDVMAQEFILQSLIQAFPEEYHIQTIDALFSIFGKVEQGVQILQIVNQLLDRFLEQSGGVIDPSTGRVIFITIAKNIEELFNSEGHLVLTDKLSTLEKLLRFALKVNPDDHRNIQNLMKFTNFHIDLAIGDESLTDKSASQALFNFIDFPLSTFTSAEPLYHVDALPLLIARLLPKERIMIATRICNIYNQSSTRITNKEQLQFVLKLTSSIVQEGNGESCFYALFHLIDAGSVINTMKIINDLSKTLIQSSENEVHVRPAASKKAILPIGFIAIELLHKADSEETNALFQFILEHGKNALQYDPQSAIKIFIETARTLDNIDSETFAKKITALTKEAINTWSDLQDPNVKYKIFNYLLQYVVSSPSIDFEEVNSQLCTMAASFSETLKSVSALTNCACLFWRPDERLRKSETVQACLSKASKAADSAGTGNIALMLQGFYLVLGSAAYFLEMKAKLQFKWLKALTGIIQEKHQGLQQKGQSLDTILPKNVREFYVSTVRHIQSHSLLPQPDDDDEAEGDEEVEADEGEGEVEAEAEADEGEAEAEGEVEADEGEGEAEGEVEADEGEGEADEGEGEVDEGEGEADEGEGEGEADEGEGEADEE